MISNASSAILLSMDVSVRKIPPELWYRVRRAVAVESTPIKRVTIREVILEAVEEWLGKRGY